MPQLPRIVRGTGNRVNRVGQVIPDRRRYYDWADDYEAACPLRPAKKSSPGRFSYRLRRTARRHGGQPSVAA